MSFDKSTFQERIDLFNSECNKLENIIDNALKKSEDLSIPEIIGAYYQIMNITSLIKFLKQSFELVNTSEVSEKYKILFKRIEEIEKVIDGKFNANLHPLIISQLADSIKDFMISLKSAKKEEQSKKPKHVIEQEAKQYEKLREIMSTKEFVEQYNKELE